MSVAEATKTKMQLVEELLATERGATMSTAELASEIGCDEGTVRRVKQRLAAKPAEPVMIAIDDLVLDCGTQMRPSTNEKREIEFAEAWADGVIFDPIEVYDTPSGLLPTDGWHRFLAAIRAGLTHILAYVIKGTEADAIRAAARANAKGTLPRCDETKRNAVLALMDLSGGTTPVADLASAAGVSSWTAKAAYDLWHKRKKAAAEAKGEEYVPVEVRNSRGQVIPPLKPSLPRRTVKEEVTLAQECPTDDDDDDIPYEPTNGHVADLVEEARLTREERESVKAKADREWLEGLYRDEGKIPVRDRLTPENRAIHDADALAYRKIHESESWKSFLSVANTAIESKKIGGAKGLHARAVSRFLRLRHPKDWVLCFSCHGAGMTADGKPCDGKCKGLGYTID